PTPAPSNITLFLFFDENENGLYDGRDTVISDMVITLKDAQNITRGVAPTDREGLVVFYNLEPGDYMLWAMTRPLGYYPTTSYPVAVHIQQGLNVEARLGFASSQAYNHLPLQLRASQP
ncbi:MAG TPA: hypothetical protein EYH29_04415, partial [Caldilineales bacterium]|nr:hypothetical protein [Caldilineales bacterium]